MYYTNWGPFSVEFKTTMYKYVCTNKQPAHFAYLCAYCTSPYLPTEAHGAAAPLDLKRDFYSGQGEPSVKMQSPVEVGHVFHCQKGPPYTVRLRLVPSSAVEFAFFPHGWHRLAREVVPARRIWRAPVGLAANLDRMQPLQTSRRVLDVPDGTLS